MNGKIIGTILGVAGVLLWFMPMVNLTLYGEGVYQAGNHIGGIAYLLLLASLAYSILSWMEQHVPRIIAASVALAISLLFLVQAGSSVAWGLLCLIIVNIVGIVVAVKDNKSAKLVVVPELFCRKCGVSITAVAQFCSECGAAADTN